MTQQDTELVDDIISLLRTCNKINNASHKVSKVSRDNVIYYLIIAVLNDELNLVTLDNLYERIRHRLNSNKIVHPMASQDADNG